jgi:RNA polymerase sigma-70 factor, ECF subfamily
MAIVRRIHGIWFIFSVAIITSDLELLQLLKTGQTTALEQLYDGYGDIMYALAFRILKNHQEAEDVIQEVFYTLWRNCTYNPERGSFKTFLLMMVRSRAIDRVRSHQTTLNVLERWGKGGYAENSEAMPLEQAVSDEIAKRVAAALAELPEKQRHALEMAYFGGLSQAEISQSLNVPLGTVKSWFRLGFSKLRQSLTDLMS